MICIISLTLFYIIAERSKNKKIAILITLTVVYMCRFMFLARAQIISFFLFLLEFLSIERLLETNKKRYAVSLIILGIVIANIHSSVFPMYFILYLPYIAEYILYLINKKVILVLEKKNIKLKNVFFKITNKFKIEKRANIRTFFITFGISLFTGLSSTAGIAPYTDMIKAMTGVSTEFIGELAHSTMGNNPYFYYILFVVLALIIITKIKPRITDVFFILGFGIMTIFTYRSLFFFLLIGATPIARIIVEFIETYNIRIKYKIIKIGITISVIIVAGISYATSFFANQITEYVPETLYPVKASDWILENLDIDNMKILNAFNYGSYIEYRGIKSFIDSRSGMFCDEFNKGTTILVDWLASKESKENFENLLEKYKITHVLLSITDKQLDYIEKEENWNLIYEDGTFFIYEKNKSNIRAKIKVILEQK